MQVCLVVWLPQPLSGRLHCCCIGDEVSDLSSEYRRCNCPCESETDIMAFARATSSQEPVFDTDIRFELELMVLLDEVGEGLFGL